MKLKEKMAIDNAGINADDLMELTHDTMGTMLVSAQIAAYIAGFEAALKHVASKLGENGVVEHIGEEEV